MISGLWKHYLTLAEMAEKYLDFADFLDDIFCSMLKPTL